jgi:membrane fusion protein (multidrug efflux system)
MMRESSTGAVKKLPDNPVVKSRFLVFAAFLLTVGAFVGGCGRPPTKAVGEVLPTVRVRVATVEKRTLPTLLEVSGTVLAVQRAAVAAKISGVVERLPVTLGQQVSAGEVLLALSAPELSARLEQARARVAQVERELVRERGLLTSGSGTTEAVKALEDQLMQARAASREAETMFGYAIVRAPFDGVVTRKHVEAGDFASPGAPLLQLDGRDVFEIETAIPESLVAGLAVASALDIETAAGVRFVSKIKELAGAADATARTVTVKLAVPAGTSVHPGEFARVFVPGAAQTVLLAPASALSRFGQMERVFVAENGRAVLRIVKTGAMRDERVELAAGVDAGEQLVVAPSATLRDGQPLEIAP